MTAKLKVVIIILYDCEKRFLLQHRSRDTKLYPNYWGFFGGQIKQGETPEEALNREAYEELNYAPRLPQLIIEQDVRDDNIEGHLHPYRIYVYIEAFDEDKLKLRLQEGQDWGWYRQSEMCDLRMIERDREIINFIMNYLEYR